MHRRAAWPYWDGNAARTPFLRSRLGMRHASFVPSLYMLVPKIEPQSSTFLGTIYSELVWDTYFTVIWTGKANDRIEQKLTLLAEILLQTVCSVQHRPHETARAAGVGGALNGNEGSCMLHKRASCLYILNWHCSTRALPSRLTMLQLSFVLSRNMGLFCRNTRRVPIITAVPTALWTMYLEIV